MLVRRQLLGAAPRAWLRFGNVERVVERWGEIDRWGPRAYRPHQVRGRSPQERYPSHRPRYQGGPGETRFCDRAAQRAAAHSPTGTPTNSPPAIKGKTEITVIPGAGHLAELDKPDETATAMDRMR